jgi:hypothetical protein
MNRANIVIAFIIGFCFVSQGFGQQKESVPDLQSLKYAFDAYVKLEISQKWHEVYQMRYLQSSKPMTEQEFIQYRTKYSKVGANLLDYSNIKYKKLDPDNSPGVWWFIIMCGKYSNNERHEYIKTGAEAYWINQEWKFSSVGPLLQVGGTSERCKWKPTGSH